MAWCRSGWVGGVARVLCAAVAVAGAGCSSPESGATTGAPTGAATPDGSTAQAAGSATGAPAAAKTDADLDKREMTAFEIEETTKEFGPAKSAPEKTVSYQKVFRQVAGGQKGYCGAHVNGPLVCWGSTPAQGMTGGFVQAAVADRFACGLENTGSIKCAPEDSAPSLAAAGAGAAPAAGTGSAAAGEAPAADPGAAATAAAAAPAEVKYKAIAAGPGHLCALDKEGHAACWGAEGACALPAAPQDVSFRSLAVGTCHACGRDGNGAVRCWAPEGTAAAKPPEGLVAKEIAAGDGFSCAVDGKGALVCWGAAPEAPADAPKEIESVGARGGSLCVLAKGGALRCWGTLQVTQAGPFIGLAMAAESVCASKSKEELACFGSEAGGQLSVPEDSSMFTVLDAGRNPEERAANKKRRADALRELLAKLQEREAPVKIDRSTKIPVGRVVEEQYLPVLDLVNFNHFFPNSHYHYGFAVKAPDKKFRLIVMHDGGTPKLMSFDADGKRLGQVALAGYAMNTPESVLFDCGDVKEEVVTESEIGADFKVTVRTTTVLEALGRLKNKEGKIQNFCKVRENTDVYAVSPLGSIDKMSTSAKVLHEKYADEACRGKWLHNPRGESYTASEQLSEACECKLHKVGCP